MIEKIEICQEGGEGIVIKPSLKVNKDFIRCSCIPCIAENCLRKILYNEDLIADEPSNAPTAEFLGDLFDNPINECSYYVKY
jgi:hypothetical protein